MIRFFRLLRRLASGIVVSQWLGNLAAILLAFAWLQIPDSHTSQFLGSVASVALLVIGFLWLHAWTFHRLAGHAERAPLWRRLFLLAVIVVVSYLVLHSVSLLKERDGLIAGYWNSRLSAGMRAFFTYQRLLVIFDLFCDLLVWVLAAALLPLAFEAGGLAFAHRAGTRLARTYFRPLYWVAAILAGFSAEHLCLALVQWKPGTSVRAQTLSVLLRIGAAYSICILLWCLVLVIAGGLMRHRHLVRDQHSTS